MNAIMLSNVRTSGSVPPPGPPCTTSTGFPEIKYNEIKTLNKLKIKK